MADATWTAESKCVKIMVTFLGTRRAGPKNAKGTLDLLKFAVDRELNVDPGFPMDTKIVVNTILPKEEPRFAVQIQKAEEYLKSINGCSTKRGNLEVVHRENVGISFGAYNYAFGRWEDKYDFWIFTEDDQVMLADGYLVRAVTQLQEPDVGFVAFIGLDVSPRPTFAHGGVGLTTRKILADVRKNNPSRLHPEGHLPYHPIPAGDDQYKDQPGLAELRFTHAISLLGYRLVILNMEHALVSWGDKGRRTPRMTPWSEKYILPG